MSADSSAKAALKPMNMVSRELRKQNPDLELIERAGKYGGNELNKAEEALIKVQKELMESQKIAKQKEKADAKGKQGSDRQKQEPQKGGISKEQMASLQAELERTGVAMEAVQERYKITSPESMNEKTYKRVMEALSKTKAA